MYISYAYDIFKKSKHRELQDDDIYKVMDDCRSDVLGVELEERWMKRKDESLLRTLINIHGWEFAFYGFLNLIIKTPITILSPFATGILVSHFQPGSTTTRQQAIISGCILVGCGIINGIFTHLYLFCLTRLGLRLEVSMCALIYRKALKLASTSFSQVASGRIVNMMTKDVLTFEISLSFVHDIWIGVIHVVIMMGLIYHKIGFSGVAGIALLISFIPLQMWLGVKAQQLRLKAAAITDERLRRIQEIITSIKLIKVCTWEKYYIKLIHALRLREIKKIRGILFLKACIIGLSYFAFRISFLTCITFYYFLGHAMSAEKVFFVITCYKSLYFVIIVAVPMGINHLADARSSLKRIQAFLLKEETSANTLDAAEGKGAVLKGVTVKIFDKCLIKNLNLDLSSPGLFGVTGAVASGKTTLFRTIMKDVKATEGSVCATRNISYASQNPWLFPGTIRQNILFGNPFDYKRYNQVLEICALMKDFASFPKRDMTAVNDKGLNLSKGQQARINLARAVYKKAEVYLLDDVLSSLDINVGTYVFVHCIKKFLKGSLCLYISHNKDFLSETDEVIVIESGGVQSKGPYNEHRLKEPLEKTQLVKRQFIEEFTDYIEDNIESEKAALLEEDMDCTKIYHENKVSGKIHFSTYTRYFNYCGGWKTIPFIVAIMLITQIIGVVFDYFVKIWLKAGEKMVPGDDDLNEFSSGQDFVLGCYFAILGFYMTLLLVDLFSFFWMIIYAAKNIHKDVFERIMGATMAFFDTHLSGNILNRLSRDINFVDEVIGYNFHEAIRITFVLLVVLSLVMYINPILGIPALIFFAIVMYVTLAFLRASRSLRRLESIAHAPCIGYLNSTLDGLTTIRAAGIQEILKGQFDNHLNLYSSVVYMTLMIKRAYALWLDFLSNMFLICVIFSFILLHNKIENIAGNVGIAVTQVIGISLLLQYGFRQWADVENTMTSLERILEFGALKQEYKPKTALHGDWCPQGKIEYKNVSLTYSNSKKKILQGITFTIQPRQKVGIIGRTGAGKSSIVSLLYRLYEAEGHILIDGNDISKIELQLLRSKISIIPQEPVIFKGTVRTNLDPYEEYSDWQLWNAIKEVGLHESLKNVGLSGEVQEGGSNWSIGQKQLLNLARVILRNNKIILLDEATSNMDTQTDAVIQETIKRLFADCTVLTIAHRIDTVIDSDMIMVIDDGKLIEYDSPERLVHMKHSVFYSVAKQAGLIHED